ncbi:hypothetical protein J4P02_20885 [Pseudomonas sp. NFXW11]|uniref:hypothetical protein n=1 Tax=Pseudomonas sp. NFXW11 TaxID=2819531 RepID=UPI003CEF9346
MRVKPLFLAIITGCKLQGALASNLQARIAQKATLTLDTPQSLLKTAQAIDPLNGRSAP